MITCGSGSDGRGRKFLTSEVLGLSAEYFREIRSDARAVEVSVALAFSTACCFVASRLAAARGEASLSAIALPSSLYMRMSSRRHSVAA